MRRRRKKIGIFSFTMYSQRRFLSLENYSKHLISQNSALRGNLAPPRSPSNSPGFFSPGLFLISKNSPVFFGLNRVIHPGLKHYVASVLFSGGVEMPETLRFLGTTQNTVFQPRDHIEWMISS